MELYLDDYQFAESNFITGRLNLIINRICEFMINQQFDTNMPDSLKYNLIVKLYAYDPDNQEISAYIRDNFIEICKYQMQKMHPKKFSIFLDSVRNFITKRNFSDLIVYANEQKNYEMQIQLTNYKNQHIGYESVEDKIRKWEL